VYHARTFALSAVAEMPYKKVDLNLEQLTSTAQVRTFSFLGSEFCVYLHLEVVGNFQIAFENKIVHRCQYSVLYLELIMTIPISPYLALFYCILLNPIITNIDPT